MEVPADRLTCRCSRSTTSRRLRNCRQCGRAADCAGGFRSLPPASLAASAQPSVMNIRTITITWERWLKINSPCVCFIYIFFYGLHEYMHVPYIFPPRRSHALHASAHRLQGYDRTTPRGLLLLDAVSTWGSRRKRLYARNLSPSCGWWAEVKKNCDVLGLIMWTVPRSGTVDVEIKRPLIWGSRTVEVVASIFNSPRHSLLETRLHLIDFPRSFVHIIHF